MILPKIVGSHSELKTYMSYYNYRNYSNLRKYANYEKRLKGG